MNESHFVITDSGGIQEEAPALGKPVIILRNETERAEAVTLGGAVLVGSDEDLIVSYSTRLLTDSAFHDSMVLGYSPYGDGTAAKRIVDYIETKL
jgi:UDP-N-acetylglucosamine 2-epimerase (non-hydrolysing)